jgi:hypothetical protein
MKMSKRLKTVKVVKSPICSQISFSAIQNPNNLVHKLVCHVFKMCAVVGSRIAKQSWKIAKWRRYPRWQCYSNSVSLVEIRNLKLSRNWSKHVGLNNSACVCVCILVDIWDIQNNLI